jgi:hypothetical protein
MQLNQRYAMQNFELMPDEVLQFGGPPEAARRLRSLLPYFRDHRLIHFADPQDLVLLQNSASRQDTPEVLAGMPVEQRLPCPVVALHDIAVHLKATAPPLNDFTASLTIWDGNQLLGKRDLPDEIIGEGWVDIPLQKTVEHCTGHPLRIRLETDDRIPGGGVVAATYLHYYRGSLSVPGWPVDTQQTLGITVNVRKRLEPS